MRLRLGVGVARRRVLLDGTRLAVRPCGPERDRWIRLLEEYQRDLEQAAADVAGLIRRVREDTSTEPTSA